VSAFLTQMYARLIVSLSMANHVMNVSMQQFMKDLSAAGIEVTRVEVDGDVETTTASVVRKGLH